MQTRSTIIQPKAGAEIPKDYLEALLKSEATIWGCAIIKGGKIIVNRSNEPSVQKILDVHGIYKDEEKVFLVSNMKEPVDPKSRQPFVLALTEEGKPAIIAFVEGDYSSHTVKDGIASDEYYFVKEVLEPLVDQFYEATNNSVEGTLKLMHNTMQQKTIQAACGERGTVVIMGNDGTINTIQRNDQDAEFSWGDVSRHHDFGLPVNDYPATQTEVTETQKEPAKEPTDEEMLALAMGGNVEEGPITPAKPDAKPAAYAGSPGALAAQKQQLTEEILAQKAKEDAAKTSTATMPPSFVRMTVPTQSNSARKDFYDKLGLTLPSDWKTRVYVDVPMNKVPPKQLAAMQKQDDSQKDVTPKLVTNAQTTSTSNGSVPSVPPTVIVPVIPLTQIKAFKDTFLNSAEVKAVMTALGGKLPTDKELQDMEAKFPKWAEQTGVQLADVCCYSHTAITAIVRDYPALAACLIGELAHSYLRNYKAPAAVTQVVPAQDNQRAVGDGRGSRRR